ncbi:unnamed protein product [Acanthoscelides obtectus]|uniref:Uncharacterized protein n=1 Tax=Acanthoscelides obtectus TaxID=200917 RepID=A0A9P0PE48_ACAOB|nr:unnamed protein product [Acanthoscelides obtectus]CAK1650028.1 hypothetical protein AOBTE_LOCUS16554 [Acanthoscelides obtectus]
MVTTGVTLEDIYKLIKEGNQELKGQINSVSKTVNEAKKEINNINNKYRDIEKENSLLKSKILNLENKLKKYNIVIYGIKESVGLFVDNDYTPEEYAKRKLLHQHLKKAREASNSAFIKNNILYVNGEAFSWEKLQNDDTGDHQDEGIIETVISKQDKNTEEQLIPEDTKKGENRLQYEPSRVNKLVPAGPSKSTPTSSHKVPKLRSTSK